MSNLNDNNTKYIKTKQRWETLTQNIAKIKNKESNSIGYKHQTVKQIKQNKSLIPIDKRIQLPSRTLTRFLQFSNSKICSNLKLKDSEGCIREFRCYDDKVLNIPSSFNYTIEHSLDNDCQSDEEQVQLAVEQLKQLLESQLNQYHKSF